MRALTSICKLLLFFYGTCLLCSCVNTQQPQGDEAFTFAVTDVGQGLSQLGVMNGCAVVWDMGRAQEYARWQGAYAGVGSPYINAIVISHTDDDHYGGLKTLGQVPFSGLVITHPFEDTTLLLDSVSSYWKGALTFKLMSQGDTLGGLPGVFIECIWPPASITGPVPVEDKNTWSMCFKITHGHNSFLVTGDIDTTAQQYLSKHYGHELYSQVIVVPHHGSRYSLDYIFYGYVHPGQAVLSYGYNNYGHPAAEVLELLFQMNIEVKHTRLQGTVSALSNGDYITW